MSDSAQGDLNNCQGQILVAFDDSSLNPRWMHLQSKDKLEGGVPTASLAMQKFTSKDRVDTVAFQKASKML